MRLPTTRDMGSAILPREQSDSESEEIKSPGLVKKESYRRVRAQNSSVSGLREDGEETPVTKDPEGGGSGGREEGSLRNMNKCNKIFENIILFLILLSSLLIAIEHPLMPEEAISTQILHRMDDVLTFLFLLESIIRIIALGLVCNSKERAYLCNPWYVLDFIVVVSSSVNFLLRMVNVSQDNILASLKALRALRALRPLRVINRNQGLRLVVNALFSTIPAMTNVVLVSSIFLVVYAILGVHFFRGGFYHCVGVAGGVDTQTQCLDGGGTWENARSNFDNLGHSLLTLFEMTTTEGWMQVMYAGVDMRGEGLEPSREANVAWVAYFILFIIIGHMFILNLFVGVVIDNFNHMKEELGGYILLSEQQRDWVEQQRYMMRRKLIVKFEVPQAKCRYCLFRVVESRFFEFAITLCIMLNTLVMAMRYYRMPPSYAQFLERANTSFAVIFNLEAAMQIGAKGLYYFKSSWNVFDFFVVFGTDVGILISILSNTSTLATAVTIIRAFRIMRIVRLIKASKNLRVISQTIVYIVPSLANIALLIFLLFFIYAALGINLFGTVKRREHITQHANFQSFFNALLLLLRCATGEKWNLLMAEYAMTSDCSNTAPSSSLQGCGSWLAYFYFLSFTVLISMMIMNLFVAVVIEGYAESTKENSGPVTSEDYDAFLKLWSEYDPNATGWIEPNDLVFMLHELEPPLGYKNENISREYDTILARFRDKGLSLHNAKLELQKQYKFKKPSCLITSARLQEVLHELSLPVYLPKKRLHFKDIIIKLTQICIQKQGLPTDHFEIRVGNVNRTLDKEWTGRFPQINTRKHRDKDPRHNTGALQAVQVIERFLMNRKERNMRHKRSESQKLKSQALMKKMEEQKDDPALLSHLITKPKLTLDAIAELPEDNALSPALRTSCALPGASRLFNAQIVAKKEVLPLSPGHEQISDWWKMPDKLEPPDDPLSSTESRQEESVHTGKSVGYSEELGSIVSQAANSEEK